MKPLVLLFLIILSVRASAQQKTGLSKEYYLEKSKKQKKVAWFTGGAGTVLLAAGTIMYLSEYRKETGANLSRMKTGEVLIFTGAGLALISVPFRLASQNNSNLAGTVALLAHPLHSGKENLVGRSNPYFSIRFRFSK